MSNRAWRLFFVALGLYDVWLWQRYGVAYGAFVVALQICAFLFGYWSGRKEAMRSIQ